MQTVSIFYDKVIGIFVGLPLHLPSHVFACFRIDFSFTYRNALDIEIKTSC